MKKIDVKKLAGITLENGTVNKQIAVIVLNKLSKTDLKQYIKYLKQEVSKKTVYVRTATTLSENNLNELKTLFKGKNVVLAKDISLVAGLSIQVNDNIMDITLKNFIDQTIDSLNQNL